MIENTVLKEFGGMIDWFLFIVKGVYSFYCENRIVSFLYSYCQYIFFVYIFFCFSIITHFTEHI
jgi:hypothetical protein